jgi:hypothetical protein
VAASEYYSDWSPDEAEYAGMASDAASTDIRLPAGDEQTDARDIAIDIDGDNYANFFDAISTGDEVNGGVDAATDDGLCDDTPEADADGPVIIDIGDVKPGDFGGAQFAFELCDNPGYVWLNGGLVSASENGTTEPEADDPDEEEDVVELLDEIQVAYGVGPINNGSTAFEDTDSGFQPVEQYTLREFLDNASSGNGLPLEGDLPAEVGGGTGRNCFTGASMEGSVHQVSVVWWLPVNHGNQVQSDSVTFDLGFYTEQCRHNDGEGMPPEDVTIQSDATGGVRETDNWITATISPGSTTSISIDLDGAVYGDEAGEWPSNSSSRTMEAVIDHDFDGLAGSDSNGYPDDFRIGYGGPANAARNAAGYNTAGGYIKRRQPDGSFTYAAEEDLSGFSATESGDQLSYTLEIDWTSDLSPTGSDVGVPSEMIVKEVFGSDGGEGVAATPNSSNDGRGNIDNTTESSGTIQL